MTGASGGPSCCSPAQTLICFCQSFDMRAPTIGPFRSGTATLAFSKGMEGPCDIGAGAHEGIAFGRKSESLPEEPMLLVSRTSNRLQPVYER
jgi:hypothetical protein